MNDLDASAFGVAPRALLACAALAFALDAIARRLGLYGAIDDDDGWPPGWRAVGLSRPGVNTPYRAAEQCGRTPGGGTDTAREPAARPRSSTVPHRVRRSRCEAPREPPATPTEGGRSRVPLPSLRPRPARSLEGAPTPSRDRWTGSGHLEVGIGVGDQPRPGGEPPQRPGPEHALAEERLGVVEANRREVAAQVFGCDGPSDARHIDAR